MKQVVSFFAAWFTQELFIKFYYEWILVRFSERLFPVFCINCLCSGFDDLRIAMMQWLSSTTNATSGASHYFDSMEL